MKDEGRKTKDGRALARGQWSEANYRRLVEWLNEQQSAQEQTQSGGPRYAVFDWDQTCLLGDIGTSTWWRQIEEMQFCFDHPDFWRLFDHVAAIQQFRADAETALGLAPEQRSSNPAYRRYLGAMVDAYHDLEDTQGPKVAYPWQSKLMVGLTRAEVQGLAQRALAAEMEREFGKLRVEHAASPAHAVPCGIRFIDEIHSLVAALQYAGITCWVVSATHQWIVESVVEKYGLQIDHVIGMRLVVQDDRLTAEVIPPTTVKQGKVEAIRKYVHPTARPLLAAGDSNNDWPMLEYAQGLRLFFDNGHSPAAEQARRAGDDWLVQPAFRY